MLYLCATPDRLQKTMRLMRALSKGSRGQPTQVLTEAPPDDDHPFVVWGQEWLAMEIIPPAVQRGRPFWHIDNGFWLPARGTAFGYYRFCYRSMTPVLLPTSMGLRKASTKAKTWCNHRDGHVLLAMPGVHYGRALGINVASWCETIMDRLKAATNRPIRVRQRDSRVPLSNDLQGAWCCVTHSSNVAVDAVRMGIPVFVEPTSPAAPVGKLDLDIEHPVMPDRTHWLDSLMCQHYQIEEMANGIAAKWMHAIANYVDRPQQAA